MHTGPSRRTRTCRALVGLWLAALVPVASAAQTADFTGSWLRNPELSQFWRELYDNAARRDTNKWEQPNVRSLVESIERQLALAEQIQLRQTARDLEFDVAGRGLRIFYFDRDHVRQTAWAENVEASMDWEGNDLVIAEVTESGSTITERLTRITNDQIAHLFIWEDSDLFARPLSIRSVYDRAPE